jgi:hypothetical protein
MGEAKRRKKQDPKWGTPIIYELKLRDRTSLLFEIPFTVPRLPTQLEVRRRAKAIGVLVMSLLQEPIAANRDRAAVAIGGEAAEQLMAIALELPKDFVLDFYEDGASEPVGGFFSSQELADESSEELLMLHPEAAAQYAGRAV